ncbi:MAG: STAS domain-containing protein [Acidobacteriota bacterium]|nr:STAS domain-containing protein [Acidobacteriota bacterium]
MLLNIQKKRVEPDIMVIALEGRICLGNSAKELEWTVTELQEANEKKVIFDLSGVTMMDSTGIGIVAMCSGKMKKAGGELRVAGAKGVVEDVLKLTHMESIVSVHATTAEAVASFTSGGKISS